MKNMKKRVSVIMAAAMAMSMAVTPVHAEEPVTLSFWSWLPTTDQSEEMIAEFEKQNPNIKIDYTRTEQDDYFEKTSGCHGFGNGSRFIWSDNGSNERPVRTVCRRYEWSW